MTAGAVKIEAVADPINKSVGNGRPESPPLSRSTGSRAPIEVGAGN
jgi:hypothetical protein